jgi:hypothetical protein
MRKMSCKPYLIELDSKIAVRWLYKVGKTMDQVRVSDELQVDCSTPVTVR